MNLRILALLPLAALLAGQRIELNLDHLEKKASKVENVNVDPAMMKMAGSFLSEKDADENMAKKVVKGMQGVYVRSFKFDKPGQLTEADVDGVRRQLQAPGWKRMVSEVDSGRESRRSGWPS